MSKPQLLRSNKYQTMSDDKIISLYMKNLGGEEKHFLDIEVDIRQLKTEADSRLSETKRSNPSIPCGTIYFILYCLHFLQAVFLAAFSDIVGMSSPLPRQQLVKLEELTG